MRDMIMHVCDSKLPSMQDMIMCVKVNLLAVGVAGSHHLEVLMKLNGPSIHGSVTHHFLDGSNRLRGVSLIKEQHCVDGPRGIFWPSLLCWFFGFPGQGFCLFDLLVDVFCCGATVHLEIHRMKWGLQKFRRILPIHHKLDVFCSGTTRHLDIHRIKVVGCRVCVCWGGGFKNLDMFYLFIRNWTSAMTHHAPWHPQNEVGASETWTCFTYSPQAGCLLQWCHHAPWHSQNDVGGFRNLHAFYPFTTNCLSSIRLQTV